MSNFQHLLAQKGSKCSCFKIITNNNILSGTNLAIKYLPQNDEQTKSNEQDEEVAANDE